MARFSDSPDALGGRSKGSRKVSSSARSRSHSKRQIALASRAFHVKKGCINFSSVRISSRAEALLSKSKEKAWQEYRSGHYMSVGEFLSSLDSEQLQEFRRVG